MKVILEVMNVILDKYPSRVDDQKLYELEIVNDDGSTGRVPVPRPHVIKGTLVYRADDTCRWAGLTALLDTGSDVTVVQTATVKDLGKQRGANLHAERKIEVYGRLRPAYDLAFVCENHPLVSLYGRFAALPAEALPEVFDLTDMLIGRDVLNQFIVALDGPNRTVTICEP